MEIRIWFPKYLINFVTTSHLFIHFISWLTSKINQLVTIQKYILILQEIQMDDIPDFASS